jgi:hypothetical protein
VKGPNIPHRWLAEKTAVFAIELADAIRPREGGWQTVSSRLKLLKSLYSSSGSMASGRFESDALSGSPMYTVRAGTLKGGSELTRVPDDRNFHIRLPLASSSFRFSPPAHAATTSDNVCYPSRIT